MIPEGKIGGFQIAVWTVLFLFLTILVGSSGVAGATNISGCTEINSSGYYVLSNNITDATGISTTYGNVCILINASNVTLDGNGFVIDGYIGLTTNYGIYTVSNHENITIKNITVRDWYYGVYMSSTHNSTISQVTLTSNRNAGIYLLLSNYNKIDRVRVIDNYYQNYTSWGINVLSSNYNIISNSTFVDVSYSISLSQAINTTIFNNTFDHKDYSFGLYGVYLRSNSLKNDNTRIINNTFLNHTSTAVYIAMYTYNTTMSGNVFKNETKYLYSEDLLGFGNKVTKDSYDGNVVSYTFNRNITVAKYTGTSPGFGYLGKFLKIYNNTGSAWINLTMYYNESDRNGIIESTIRMWGYNGSSWYEVPGTNGVNTIDNYVYANITEFAGGTSSVFGPKGTNQISECALLDTPGNYYVNTDLINATSLINVTDLIWGASKACVVVTSSNVSIFGNGHRIDGTDDTSTYNYGIFVFSGTNGTYLENIQIRDVNVSDWSHDGIFLDFARNVDIVDSASMSNGKDGIHVRHSENIDIENVTITDIGEATDGSGIYFMETTGSSIKNSSVTYTDNPLRQNKAMLITRGSHNNYIAFNNISYNRDGIYIDSSNNNTIYNNTFLSNSASGIYITGSDNSTVLENYGYKNKWGLQVYNSGNTTIRNNTFTESTDYGIWLDLSDYSELKNNTVSKNSYGILLMRSDYNVVDNNIVDSNTYGIQLGYNFPRGGLSEHSTTP
ncbi:right-handed parallel beta-helix repeat-containing protein [Geoglobus ahangari]